MWFDNSQKTGNAIRALGRMATLSAATRRNSTASGGGSPRPSLSGSVTRSWDEELGRRPRACSERSDSGISDCSSGITPLSGGHLLGGHLVITEEELQDDISLDRQLSTDEVEGEDIHETPNTDIDRSESTCIHKSSSNGLSGDSNNDLRKGVNKVIENTDPFSNSGDLNIGEFSDGLNNGHSCSSPTAKCIKKTASLKHQGSADSGVNLDVGVRSKINTYLKNAGQKVSESEVKPKTAPALATSNEHSSNYQKAMAFWKR